MRLHFSEIPQHDRRWEQGVPIVSILRAVEEIATNGGIDVVHRAVNQARNRRLLREDEPRRLVARFGATILNPYDAQRR